MTVDALAALLDEARRTRRAIDPPHALDTIPLAAAYDVQDAVVRLRERDGARSGWKLGITSPVKQRVMGIDHPLFGRTFADGERRSGDHVAFDAFVAPRTEPEIAFGLAEPLRAGMDRRAAWATIAWFAPALEITDSRFRPGTRSAVELVADNTASAAYVLGAPFAAAGATVTGIETLLVRNGVIVQRGMTEDVLGDPVLALIRLGDHLAQRGLQSEPGEIVLSGAITDAIPVTRGDAIEAQLTGHGAARVRFT